MGEQLSVDLLVNLRLAWITEWSHIRQRTPSWVSCGRNHGVLALSSRWRYLRQHEYPNFYHYILFHFFLLADDYLHTAPDNFRLAENFADTSFTPNRSIFSLCSHVTVEPGWISTFLRGFTICPCAESYLGKSKMAPSGRVTTHPCNRAFTVHIAYTLRVHIAPVKFSSKQVKHWPRFWSSNFWP